MLRVTKNRFYAVPVLMRTLDILEFLGKSDCPLRMKEISHGTGVSQTTTYRILRTLIHRGYVVQDIEGSFSLLNRSEMNLVSVQRTNSRGSEPMPLHRTDLSGDQVIEILYGVLQTLGQGNGASLEHQVASRQSRYRKGL